MELTLAHHPVASKTEVLNEGRAVSMVGQMPMEGGLGVELREKDRVTSRQTHHRVTPFAERREVRGRRALRTEDHVGDQAGERAGRVVTLGALVSSDKLIGTAGGLRGR